MANDESSKPRAQSKKYKSIFVFFVGISHENRTIVVEDSLRFLERNAVFALVCCALAFVPFET